MSASVEASRLLREIVSPTPAGTKVKVLIAQAARRLGWSYSRTFDVYYQKARRIDAAEMDALRKAARMRAEGDGARENAELRTYLRAVMAEFENMDRA